jgi:hypothetical protein
MELQKSEKGRVGRALEKAALAFRKWRMGPDELRADVLSRHAPDLERAKREIYDTSLPGLWSWKHFRCGWKAELGSPELSRKERRIFAKELIVQLCGELSKEEPGKESQFKAMVLFCGLEAHGLHKKIGMFAAMVISEHLKWTSATEWPHYEEAIRLARKWGWKDDVAELKGRLREWESGLTRVSA